MNWKLTLAYDGSDFHGWQIQPSHVTIQGELAAALERITGERVLPQGSGRTDTGVHARAQVASFFLNAPIPPENLHRALNRTLPAAIRILSAEHASPEFHARHSVVAKTYEYRLWVGGDEYPGICPPWLARYVYAVSWPLDPERMREAASLVIGEHDFTSFAATDPDLATRLNEPSEPSLKTGNIRTIFSSEFLETSTEGGNLLLYRVRGNGFLHHMVRNLVGTFLDAGRGHIAPGYITHILDRRTRSAAGPTAPARGLFLDSVEY
jgi:tRNA pseudouridine38-40 synthase